VTYAKVQYIKCTVIPCRYCSCVR